MNKYIFLSILFLATCNIYAEIQTAVVSWNPAFCREECAKLLSEAFNEVKNSSEVLVSPEQGQAVFTWTSGKRISYQMLKKPMQSVGVGLSEIFLKVRGTLRVRDDNFYLISTGDGMSFELVGTPSGQSPTRFMSSSAQPRPLPDGLKALLTSLLDAKETVIIEGLFYKAYRSPPYRLVASRVLRDEK